MLLAVNLLPFLFIPFCPHHTVTVCVRIDHITFKIFSFLFIYEKHVSIHWLKIIQAEDFLSAFQWWESCPIATILVYEMNSWTNKSILIYSTLTLICSCHMIHWHLVVLLKHLQIIEWQLLITITALNHLITNVMFSGRQSQARNS